MPSPPRSRRILAIFLPHLLSEIVQSSQFSLTQRDRVAPAPQGIVVVDSVDEVVTPQTRLTSACPRAVRAGVCAGQSIIEACAMIAHLQIELVEKALINERLIAVAESVQAYGSTVSWNSQNTVYLDVSGVSHLFGGEENLADEVQEQVRLLGHVARVVIANGPQIARAVAQYTPGRSRIVPSEEAKSCVQDLPLSVLPLDEEGLSWFNRLGLLTVGQLASLPPSSLSSRLGPFAQKILLFLEGVDETPLTPGIFPAILTEEIDWEEPALGLPPLLFALRGLVSKLSTRLIGRGEACSLIEVTLKHDPAIARHRGVLSQSELLFELSSPLFQKTDLERIIKTRLERHKLAAPSVGLRVKLQNLSPQMMNQLKMSAQRQDPSSPWGVSSKMVGDAQRQELSLLVAELSADLKKEELGILKIEHSHRPEALSRLIPLFEGSKRRSSSPLLRAQPLPRPHPLIERMTRLLPEAKMLKIRLRVGECIAWGLQLYAIEKVQFIKRLEKVEWWCEQAASRDYFWVWLKGPVGSLEALFYIERRTQEVFLQGFGD